MGQYKEMKRVQWAHYEYAPEGEVGKNIRAGYDFRKENRKGSQDHPEKKFVSPWWARVVAVIHRDPQ